MTTPPDPDALASALLDGLLTDDEAAAARRDPAVASRLADLAAVREAVRRPPAGPDPATRERALAAALAAYDAGDERSETDGTLGAVVRPMSRGHAAARTAESRAGMPSRGRGPRRGWLAAAVVALVVVGVGVLASNWDGGGGDGDTAAQEAATDERSNAGGGTAGPAQDARTDTSGDGLAAAGPAGEIVDLGDVDSSDALVDRARSILTEQAAGPQREASGGEGTEQAGGGSDSPPAKCRDGAAAEALAATPGTVALRARATLDGKAVDVWVFSAQGQERLIVVDASCAVVIEQPLPN
jgi:hypothetical protein